ncbi:hypothetical protein [Corynebacterium doosanense]|uniref:Uncharacterized protein n=1 Tax=Corynebacterium doosanense CAU 212 = DSM 45436 TaxID=558173 RepID=A0A097IJ68_9CORY|nr:hypothetical protein [Corynebacterium doosanense]AIT62186.1 hypothetical protein CDOO_02000 [Corynebacterium doosanense CAU 212 = DSM 45436]
MGVSPDRYTPRWDGSPQDLRDYGTAGNDLGSGLTAGFNNIIGGIGDAIRGIFSPGGIFAPVGEAIKPIRDGQLDLLERTDLLEGIQGYCAAYLTENINVEWSRDNWRDIKYSGRLGPEKSISLDPSSGQMVLGGGGLYTAYAKLHARRTSFTGGDYGYLIVEVLRPDSTVYSRSHSEFVIPRDREQTLFTAYPFVVPAEGYRVKVRAYSDNWRWWQGGTERSTLHVIRHSAVAENSGQQNVPDETQPG